MASICDREGREYTPLRNTKEEAFADLTKARENAIDSTDMARGLAAVRTKKLAAKINSLQKRHAGLQHCAKRSLLPRLTACKKRLQKASICERAMAKQQKRSACRFVEGAKRRH